MTAKRSSEFMRMSLEKAIEIYLATLATEGKSPRYIGWLKTRLRYFTDFIYQTQGKDFRLQDLTVEVGRGFIRDLMGRDVKYSSHPFLAKSQVLCCG